MKMTGLSLEQAPPLSVPFRFFLTAPIFGAISALLLIYQGPDVLVSRWTPGMLAITHGVVLGFLASVMFGALQQMLPVLAGAIIPRPRLSAWVLHLLWVPGVLLLLGAFFLGQPPLFVGSLALLGGSVFFFGLLCTHALLRVSSRSDSVPGMKLAIISLLVTVLLGIVLGLGHSGKFPLLRPMGTNLHLMWGLLGWVGLLIVSVAWQVVPMFQITKPYPTRLVRFLAPALFVLLLARSLVSIFTPSNQNFELLNHELVLHSTQLIIDGTISLLLLGFAYHTLRLQYNRLRKIKDYHIVYWQVASLCLILSIVCWWSSKIADDAHLMELLRLLSTVLFLAGFVMGVVTAMLYKIVAFLVWFHLQGINTQQMMAGKPSITVPHMKTVISDQCAKVQYTLYLFALFSLPPAIIWPAAMSQLAGALWLLHFGVMATNLTKALFTYKTCLCNS